MIARIFRLGLNELRLTWKDKTSLIWMAVMPLAFILFFGSVSGRDRGEPSNTKIRLSLADQDLSWLSRALVDTLEGEDFAVTEPENPADLLGMENRTRTLVIPAGLTDAVARKEQVTLFLARQPGINDRATAVAEIHITRALIQLLGTVVQMQAIAGENEPLDLQADRVAEYRRLSAEPRLVNVEPSYAGAGREPPQGFGQAIPGMMTQFIVMITMISGSVYLTQEKASGVLRRLAISAFTPRTLLAGKLTGMVMLALVQAGILMAAGALIGRLGIFGAEFYWGEAPFALALLILSFAICTGGITLFIGAILSTPAQASGVGWLSGMIMAGLGGCWWPLEVTPEWLQTAGHVFPTAWMMDALHELISFGQGLDAIMMEMAILLVYGVVFALLGARFLKV